MIGRALLTKVTLVSLFGLSLVLNVWGNRWGAPAFWHPDELTRRAELILFTRDVNPHRFVYGGLHYYQLAVGAALPVWAYEKLADPKPHGSTGEMERWRERHLARLTRAARFVSAVLTSLLALVVFAIGALLFSRPVGVLAALFVALSPGAVVNAHFATADAAANFWYWLACLLALVSWRRGSADDVKSRSRSASMWYALSAIAGGFAVGTKLDRAIVVIPLVVAHFLRREAGRARDLLVAAILLPLAFVAVNPALIVAPFEFVDGVTREMFYTALLKRAPDSTKLRDIVQGLGWPLVAGAALGFIVAAGRLFGSQTPPPLRPGWRASGSGRSEIVWLLATFLPYLLFYLFRSAGRERYSTMLLPALALLAAVGIVSVVRSRASFLRGVSIVAAGVVAGWGLLQCVAVDLQFVNDPRYAAAAWIQQHAAVGSRIGVDARGLAIDTVRYRVTVVERPLVRRRDRRTAVEALERSGSYVGFRGALTKAEAWAGRELGVPVRAETYDAWFDQVQRRERNAVTGTSPLPDVDFLVVPADHAARIRGLQSRQSRYRVARRLDPPAWLGLRRNVDFVSSLLIFERRPAGGPQERP